ncbi:hypothetical protein [Deinococcus peraridilitoris]|uniref:Uncharacterized protein n=1 Tax=Deinococcus peraridilitoris (strain DSM 19664 / LMG 22246 / CIP 109416 / KR-200) TaxID=937777 RepID=K9ZXD0_DEIPD|nr:hypothetical protein [Deinococcus peraridilitoris]AFZ66313.1 hypothetical protein Deipe_0734 [Deinococcus peraridilitoris DSM 19664]
MRFERPRLLDRRGHARVDYLTFPLLLLISEGLSGPARTASRSFGVLIALAVTTTRTPLGLLRIVPFRWHGRLELSSVFVQLALPWLAGFAHKKRERNFWLAFSAYNFLVWLRTDWAAPE